MRKVYVCSKPLPTKKGFGSQPRLIGILTELKPGGNEPEQYGEYQFEYTTKDRFPEWFMQLEEFPDPARIYANTPEVLRFIQNFVLSSDYKYFDAVLESMGLKEYNEWAFLTNTGDDSIHLCETLPENVIIY